MKYFIIMTILFSVTSCSSTSQEQGGPDIQLQNLSQEKTDPIPDEQTSIVSLEEDVEKEKENEAFFYHKYIVQPDDTLSRISLIHYGTIFKWRELKEWNNIKHEEIKDLTIGKKVRYRIYAPKSQKT